MPWTAPRTWTTGELVTAALLNEQLRDNLLALTPPAAGTYTGDGTTNRTITLAATPKLVIVTGGTLAMFCMSNVNGGTAGLFSAGPAAPDASGSTARTTRPEITTNGFIVSGAASGTLNESGATFQYIVFNP